MTTGLEDVLRELYRGHLAEAPGDRYIRDHAGDRFLAGTVRFFRFYEPYLAGCATVLDWGCHHAPDACLLRASRGSSALEIEGCDVLEAHAYQQFFAFAGLRYTRLTHPFLLPYGDDRFDAVVASGVLEHVPMAYESLKELHRVLKPGGRLIVGYLPSQWSVEEWWLRRRGQNNWHRQRYATREFRALLMSAGFLPRVLGYQTQLHLLPSEGGLPGRAAPLFKLLSLHRLTSCLCGIADKTLYF